MILEIKSYFLDWAVSVFKHVAFPFAVYEMQEEKLIIFSMQNRLLFCNQAEWVFHFLFFLSFLSEAAEITTILFYSFSHS
jgi:hypothetical protein